MYNQFNSYLFITRFNLIYLYRPNSYYTGSSNVKISQHSQHSLLFFGYLRYLSLILFNILNTLFVNFGHHLSMSIVLILEIFHFSLLRVSTLSTLNKYLPTYLTVIRLFMFICLILLGFVSLFVLRETNVFFQNLCTVLNFI